MTLHAWWLFFVAVFFLSGSPGPNMLHILSRSVEMGAKRSVAAMAGCVTAVILVLSASAAGLTTLLLAVPGAFDVLRYGGAAYLIYLGIKAWRADVVAPVADAGVVASNLSNSAMFRGGFAISVSNPKLILFSAAFLPQFVDPARPQAPQFAILVATFALVEMFWYAMYGIGGNSLSRYIARPAISRLFNRVTGAIFAGFGVALLKMRPA